MNREEAICYLKSSGMSDEQIKSVIDAFTYEDCISRAQALRHRHLIYDDDGAGYSVVRVDEIEQLPSVTPTRPKGKWIAQDIHNCHTNFKCSECSYIHNFTHLYGEPTAVYPYCPICGADMRGDTE